MSKYSVYTGKFPCHTCKVEVTSIRHYPEISELTWVCPEKHLSSVNLKPKKSDYTKKKNNEH